jgi:hypothetical protein
MSWDIFVQDLPIDARTIEDISGDFVPSPIGRRSEIIMKILEIAPFADFSDPSWGRIGGKDFSIEVNLGDSEIVEGFTLHVRGSELASGIVADILRTLQMRALDSSTGDIFDPGQAVASLQRWRAYRDRVVNAVS